MTLDHLILDVTDRSLSVRFYTAILGFADEGLDGPFAVVRVGPDTTLQLAQRPTPGGVHLAFALSRAELEATLGRIRDAGIAYGDTFATVGNMRIGSETGARGPGDTVYFFDPDRHLLEIRCYA